MTGPADRFRPETLVAIEAANVALTIARRGGGREPSPPRMGVISLTAADVAVEDTVRRITGDGRIDVAERGRGAWRGDGETRHRLMTSDDSRAVVVEDGKSKGARREAAARFTATVIRMDRWDFRSPGTTLAAPYVAAGRIAAYVVFWVSALHTAAGTLLISEAGGTVSDLEGRPWTIDSDSLVGSANRHLHEDLLGLLHTSR